MNEEKGRDGKMPGDSTPVELHKLREEAEEIKRIPMMQKGCTNIGKVSKELVEMLEKAERAKRVIDE